MGKGNTWSADILALLFNGTTAANIAQNASVAPITNLYISLHTANPGAAGAQNTSEAAYTNYARVAVARTAGGWTLAGTTITPVANISFPVATGGSEIETFFGIGTLVSGAGVLLYSGLLFPSIVVVSGVQPILTTGTTVTET